MASSLQASSIASNEKVQPQKNLIKGSFVYPENRAQAYLGAMQAASTSSAATKLYTEYHSGKSPRPPSPESDKKRRQIEKWMTHAMGNDRPAALGKYDRIASDYMDKYTGKKHPHNIRFKARDLSI